MTVLKVENLSKRYHKRGEFAVKDISFTCEEGEIVGLVGHNGAGKSTTVKCLEGMLPYDGGRVEICGFDMRKKPLAAKANFGFVTDDHAAFVRMTGRGYLSFLGDIYGVPTKERKGRMEELEKVFCLGKAIDSLIFSYSHGMRQKICMMGSLLHRPKLWVLDEPMTGLDPVTVRSVKQYMQAYAKEGHAVLFSSHDLPAVAALCDRAVLLKGGRQVDVLPLKEYGTERGKLLEERYFHEN